VAPAGDICGRAPELSVLDEALDRIESGRRCAVLIEGEAGIGKTRLLETMLAAARARGMQTMGGQAGELERARPFGLLASAFGCARSSPDPRRAGIAELLASRGTGERDPVTVTSDPGLRFLAVDAFADLAAELASPGPLLIGLDDLQWADSSSLLAVGALSRHSGRLPIGIVGCFRPSPRPPDLGRLVAALESRGARHLILSGLAERDISELVAGALGAVPGPGLLAMMAGAAGNPLFVAELLEALAGEGMIETAGGQADVADVALPPMLRMMILRHLSFLPDGTVQALLAASILGSAFTVTDLSVTMARPAIELSPLLAEGIRARILADDGSRLRFRHGLIRDAIYEDQPLSIRQGLHREAGQRLAQAGAPSRQVAGQMARSAAASTGGHVALAFVRFVTGEWDEAITELEAIIEQAEDTGETRGRGDAHSLLSLISLHRNNLTQARHSARAAAKDLAGGGSCHGMTWAAWSRALVMEADGEPGGALAILAARWDRCLSSGIGPQCPALGADLVRLALTAGDLGRARDTAATVTRMACGGEVPWLTGAALRCRGLAEDDAEILQAAADAYAPAARPLYLALACEDAGAAFARLGQQDRSRPLLERAIGIYERLRAARDLARAGAALRGAGVRRGQRGARGRPQIGWPSLTPTEHTVAGLVTEGLSNPQIGERLYISHRTVQSHVAHIFAKLDISSRTELAAEVARQEARQAG